MDAKDLPSANGGGVTPTASSPRLPENGPAHEGRGPGTTASGSIIATGAAARRVSPRPSSSRSEPYPASSSNGAASASLTTSGARPAVAPKRPTTTSAARPRMADQPGTAQTVAKDQSARPQRKDPDPVQLLQLDTGEWACPTCTLLNPESSLQCDACGTHRPSAKANGKGQGGEGWWCEFCGSGPREMGFWSCGECGWVRKWG